MSSMAQDNVKNKWNGPKLVGLRPFSVQYCTHQLSWGHSSWATQDWSALVKNTQRREKGVKFWRGYDRTLKSVLTPREELESESKLSLCCIYCFTGKESSIFFMVWLSAFESLCCSLFVVTELDSIHSSQQWHTKLAPSKVATVYQELQPTTRRIIFPTAHIISVLCWNLWAHSCSYHLF